MSYLPSLPEDTMLLDVFRAYPDAARPLLEYHEVVLRGPSPLTVAQRELIAAYVSGLNSCGYCQGIHAAVAARFDVPVDVLTALVDDLGTAPVEEAMRPLLRYVAKLTSSPSKVTPTDARTVLDAGWSERALHDAVSVCALFNLMNRLVDGLGVTSTPDRQAMSARRLADIGYLGLRDLL